MRDGCKYGRRNESILLNQNTFGLYTSIFWDVILVAIFFSSWQYEFLKFLNLIMTCLGSKFLILSVCAILSEAAARFSLLL